MKHLLLVLPALAASLLAQSTIVSPIGTATVEGDSMNTYPFAVTQSRRYLQVHSDLGPGPRLITKLSFRANGSITAVSAMMTTDLELYMGPGVAWDKMSYVFDSNYVQPKSLVLTRKIVNLGPLTPSGSPAPFTMDLVLDTPFLDVGASSLVWEAVIYSNTIAGTVSNLDADSSSMTAAPGRPPTVVTGNGCIVTGLNTACAMDITAGDVAGLLAFGVAVNNAPPNAPAVLAIGTKNPNVAVPGLCSNLCTDLLLMLPLIATDANGVIGEPNSAVLTLPSEGSTFAIPNLVPGVAIHSQVHVVDAGSSQAIPVINSNGRSITMPTSNKSKVVKVSRLFNNLGGVTATRGMLTNSTTLGYGLVTRFTY